CACRYKRVWEAESPEPRKVQWRCGADARAGMFFHFALVGTHSPRGAWPWLAVARLRQLGFAIVLLPVDTLLVAVQSIRDFLAAAKARDDVQALKDRYMPFRDFNELIGVNAQLALAGRYTDDARSAT